MEISLYSIVAPEGAATTTMPTTLLSAAVPGCVRADLVILDHRAAGLVDDNDADAALPREEVRLVTRDEVAGDLGVPDVVLQEDPGELLRVRGLVQFTGTVGVRADAVAADDGATDGAVAFGFDQDAAASVRGDGGSSATRSRYPSCRSAPRFRRARFFRADSPSRVVPM